MPSRRFDWHEHIKAIEHEYSAARLAIDHFRSELLADPANDRIGAATRAHLRNADKNLEGTYLVRLFATFEAALRSYDRAQHNNPARTEKASVLIDSIGGRRGQGISTAIREGAHAVREVRNYWAHETQDVPAAMTMAAARARLQRFLSWLPEQW